MKTHIFRLILGASTLLVSIQATHAEVKVQIPTLIKKGDFIEVGPSEYLRSSSIIKIEGYISLILSCKTEPAWQEPLEVPLTADGLKKLKETNLAELIATRAAEYYPKRLPFKPEDSRYEISVYVISKVTGPSEKNNTSFEMVTASGDSVPKSWDMLDKPVQQAMEALDRLILLASSSPAPAPAK